jgi:hypothetical protein
VNRTLVSERPDEKLPRPHPSKIGVERPRGVMKYR